MQAAQAVEKCQLVRLNLELRLTILKAVQKLAPRMRELTLRFMAGASVSEAAHDIRTWLCKVSAPDLGLPPERYGQETVAVRCGAVVLRACVAERVVHALTLIAPSR